MRTGERCSQWGFTYLWLLFLLAAGAAGLGVAGQRWSGVLQSERERELLFRGAEIAKALAAYRAVPVEPGPDQPFGLEDLVEDRRGPGMRRHLRRAYEDPFTGQPDWVLLRGEDGRWIGVRSRSDAPARITVDLDLPAKPLRPARVSDHRFLAASHTAAAPAAPATPAAAADPEGSSATPPQSGMDIAVEVAIP